VKKTTLSSAPPEIPPLQDPSIAMDKAAHQHLIRSCLFPATIILFLFFLKGKTVGENPYCGINIYIKKGKNTS